MPELPRSRRCGVASRPRWWARDSPRRDAAGDLRAPFPPRFAERLKGRRIEALTRRAKYLLAALDGGETLILHLGMSGSFRVEGAGAGPSRRRISRAARTPRTTTSSSSSIMARASSTTTRAASARWTWLRPGRDRLKRRRSTRSASSRCRDDFDAARLAALSAGSRAPIKTALIDQKRIAGLGNIYACEALWRARISPLRPAAILADARGRPTAAARALAPAIRAVLEEAVEAGGSTLRDHRRPDGELGYFQHSFAVYDREGAACPRRGCRSLIARIVQGGRSSFYCPACQK